MYTPGPLQAQVQSPSTQGAPDSAYLRGLSVAQLAQRCRQEKDKFLEREPSDPWYGYELFRRAICLGDEDAWRAVIEQFRGMLRIWVRRHPATPRGGDAGGEDADDWVDHAFSRFWVAVRPERFHQFPDLPSLLRYLKLCLYSILTDAGRARGTAAGPLDALGQGGPQLPDVAAVVGAQMDSHELWEIVLDELEDEAERRLVYLSFVQALKPRQVHARHPEWFPDVADVYRIKRNVLERLRRSPRMARFG